MPVIFEHEIQVIFNYIIPNSTSNLYAEKYKKGVEVLELDLNQKDQIILNFILTHKNLIQFVDCGLRLFLKESNLKKRFLLASSIVESSPESFDLFLNSEKVKFPKLHFIWVGIETVFTMIVSFFLFKFKGWK
jgi:hypothetical protein